MEIKVETKQSILKLVSQFILLASLSLFSVAEVFAEDTGLPATCIDLEKTGPLTAIPGDVITYSFSATNCGEILLGSGAYIYDLMFNPVGGLIWAGELEPGATHIITKQYEVTDGDCGDLINDAWALGFPEDGQAMVRDDSQWIVDVDCGIPENPGTGTPGYWKTHPDAWPVDHITIGGTIYTKDGALDILDTPEKGNKLRTVFRALVSAKLNVEIGNDDSCIADTILEGDAWMISNGPIGASPVRGNSDAWVVGEPLSWTLDSYNNGYMCAPHRD